MTFVVGIVARAAAMVVGVTLLMIVIAIGIELFLPGERPAPLCGRLC